MDTTGLVAASNSLLNSATQLYSMKQQDELNKWTQQMGEKQFDAQQDWATKMFDYQKLMNEVTMEREDNAVQRRSRDLAAAGLNPNLAVGQPASSQGFSGAGSISPVSTNAGKVFTPKFSSMIGAYLDARMQMAQIKQVQEQSDLLQKQSKYYDALSGKVNAETSYTGLDTQKLRHDLDFYIRYGLPTNSGSSKPAQVAGGMNMAKTLTENLVTTLEDSGVSTGDAKTIADVVLEELNTPEANPTTLKDVVDSVVGGIGSMVDAVKNAPWGEKRKAAWNALKSWDERKLKD